MSRRWSVGYQHIKINTHVPEKEQIKNLINPVGTSSTPSKYERKAFSLQQELTFLHLLHQDSVAACLFS